MTLVNWGATIIESDLFSHWSPENNPQHNFPHKSVLKRKNSIKGDDPDKHIYGSWIALEKKETT